MQRRQVGPGGLFSDASRPPRRLATARLDLGLILARARRPDEAAALGVLAFDAGVLVPSNAWRAIELDDALDGFRDVPEVAELHARRRAIAP
ncbi:MULTISPECIES: hypothetical protein [unclassified Pseudonocardia]|uniref:hypothetical protein n=1 Tax=unclassified Pseudonocardia TaxID=2619320 RepID=UPI0001FFE498|nr:hypothetical protein [Pseudonocardia sp. Ae707_Ps1]OLM20325.1 hypothetical protein Ae707Ps1_4584c [Pseudonocardia sp. Ae707_Ps1]